MLPISPDLVIVHRPCNPGHVIGPRDMIYTNKQSHHHSCFEIPPIPSNVTALTPSGSIRVTIETDPVQQSTHQLASLCKPVNIIILSPNLAINPSAGKLSKPAGIVIFSPNPALDARLVPELWPRAVHPHARLRHGSP